MLQSEIGDFTWRSRRVVRGLGKANSYWPRVKTGMSAAEIDALCRDAVPGWKKLGYVISAMRTQYLEDKLTAE